MPQAPDVGFAPLFVFNSLRRTTFKSAQAPGKDNHMQTYPYPRLAALLCLGFVTGGVPAAAQNADPFYKGKTLDLLIGYPPGGSNDAYGRLVARHLGRHIPGQPTVVPKNMPGAGSFLAVNTVFNISPKDGSVIGIGAPTLTLDEKLGTQGVRYKTSELNWIGRVDSLINMVFTWKTVPVKTFAEAQNTQVTLAGTGAGSTVSIYPTVMNNVFGTKFKLIMGYKGSNEAMLAVERGETEGHSTSYTALKIAHPDWLRDKSVSILVQFGLKRHPEMSEIPTAVELARNDEERKVLTAITAASEIGTAFFTTPGVPAERLAELRRGFDAMVKDPEFLTEAERIKLSIDPLSGAELQKLVADVSNLPPDLVEKVRAVYATAK
jgi:tripartite-type tricarboxylate transporter receptor subunit TctC